MKHLNLLLLLLSISIFGQGTRIAYEYEFAPNINQKDTIKKETVFLDIRKDGSKFYSQKQFVADSLRDQYFKQMRASGTINTNFKGTNPGMVKYNVTKSYPDYNIVLKMPINTNNYAIKNEKSIVWKIDPETKKIDKFTAQKATTEFGGRSWTAWFTQELPFQDGPYKFSGLPGLILEMQDATGTHAYKFLGIKKFDDVEIKESANDSNGRATVIIGGSKGKPLDVTEAKFTQLWKEYKNDPVKDMRQTLSQGNVKMKLNMNGKDISDPNEIIRTMEKSQKEAFKNDNNPLELTLFP
ncbi:GLPGLI family protein [Soonwooa sp.]|uniref:GLPGLI family protein n=1 Tax=Soonwooa sp. TaxID=1938592 RepID=UPI0028AD8206|nr:GLPGLI family protein [Soonwooa sp.]